MMNSRRRFFRTLGGLAALAVMDPEELIWTPKRKMISLPPIRLCLPDRSLIKVEYPNGYVGHRRFDIPTTPFSFQGLCTGLEMVGKIRFTPAGVPIFRIGETNQHTESLPQAIYFNPFMSFKAEDFEPL